MPCPDQRSLALSLQERRANEGQTRAEQARAIGVSERVLRLAEHGVEPRPANKLPIATYLGCKVTDIWPVQEQAA